MARKIGYLGPTGTFCEQAAHSYFAEAGTRKSPYRSIQEVFNSVQLGEVDAGVVPIENSCEGAVNNTLDLLAGDHNLQISGEIILPVRQNLLVRPGVSMQEISCVLSHPQALAQCRKYIKDHFPLAAIMDTSSTAEAARKTAQSCEPWASIGPVGAAKTYGLISLARDINDLDNNETRFVILSRTDGSCIRNCKTSLLVYVLNQPGALFQVLKEFSLRGVNLTKIESRPTRTKMGDYLFFIDIEGHRLEPRIKDALEGLKTASVGVKVLGSYPAAGGKSTENKITPQTLGDLREEIDIIDDQIIEMLGRRTRLVEKVCSFKRDASDVRDPERENWILEKLSVMAEQKGFNSQVAVNIYKILFDYFVSLQQKKLVHKHGVHTSSIVKL